MSRLIIIGFLTAVFIGSVILAVITAATLGGPL